MPREVRRNPCLGRRLRVEHLEDRRLLAVLTVQNDLDDTLANLAGDGELSLREAIEIANNPGTVIDGFVSNDVDDTVEFARPFFDQPRMIFLEDGELSLEESVSILGTGRNHLTLNGMGQSRHFNIIALDGDFALSNLTLTGGHVAVPDLPAGTLDGGGAIRSVTEGKLLLHDMIVSKNSVSGRDSAGGAIFSGEGELYLRNTTINENSNYSGAVAGIYVGTYQFPPGTVVRPNGAAEILNSTISNNVLYEGGLGATGGVRSQASLTLVQSTVSGNRVTSVSGSGGVQASGILAVNGSTIVENQAITSGTSQVFQGGGGVRIIGLHSETRIESSVIALNFSRQPRQDISLIGQIDISRSLIGDTTGTDIDSNTGNGNLLNVDPLLGPLAENGGPTHTHALLPGSPALDAGDPAIGFEPGEFDQRGAPFSRVASGILSGVPQQRIDIGAYEAQSPPSADFVDDDHLNGQDFLAWQLGLGLTENATRADGDSDGDGDVDLSDLAAWRVSYGQTEAPPPPVAALGGRDQGSGAREEVSAALVDAVLELVGDERDEHEVVIADQLFVGVASDANEGNFLPAVAAQPETSASHSEPTDERDSLVFQVGEDLLGFGL